MAGVLDTLHNLLVLLFKYEPIALPKEFFRWYGVAFLPLLVLAAIVLARRERDPHVPAILAAITLIFGFMTMASDSFNVVWTAVMAASGIWFYVIALAKQAVIVARRERLALALCVGIALPLIGLILPRFDVGFGTLISVAVVVVDTGLILLTVGDYHSGFEGGDLLTIAPGAVLAALLPNSNLSSLTVTALDSLASSGASGPVPPWICYLFAVALAIGYALSLFAHLFFVVAAIDIIKRR